MESMENIPFNTEFEVWIEKIKKHIQQRQINALQSLNREMIRLYWFLGKQITEKQAQTQWGNGFVKNMSAELQRTFPKVSGFSTDNLRFMKRMYLFYNEDIIIFAQAVQILQNNINLQPIISAQNETQ